MKFSGLVFHLLGALFLLSPVIADDQRILLSFDNSGHQVRQIVRSPPRTLRESSADGVSTVVRGLRDIQVLIAELQPGVAVLLWADDDGHIHARTEEPDPRISHAPAHIDGSSKSRSGNTSGAWLIGGPEEATSVTILLPSDPSLGLAFEQWDVQLVTW